MPPHEVSAAQKPHAQSESTRQSEGTHTLPATANGSVHRGSSQSHTPVLPQSESTRHAS